MEVRFVSNKPWVDDTIKTRKALFISTIFMVILGLIFCILGGALMFYTEFALGVISLIFGILLPVGYVGANALLFARRRRDYDKNSIIEYKFTDEAIEIIKLSTAYKSKDVISYSNLDVHKVYNKPRFIIIKTNSNFADYIVLRKSDIKIADGEDRGRAINGFISFLLAKVAEANAKGEITCAEDIDDVESKESETDNDVNESTFDFTPQVNDMDASEEPMDDVKFVDYTTRDDVVDIEDDAKEEPMEEESVDDSYDSLFSYDEDVLTDEDMNSSEEPKEENYLFDYRDDDNKQG